MVPSTDFSQREETGETMNIDPCQWILQVAISAVGGGNCWAGDDVGPTKSE